MGNLVLMASCPGSENSWYLKIHKYEALLISDELDYINKAHLHCFNCYLIIICDLLFCNIHGVIKIGNKIKFTMIS